MNAMRSPRFVLALLLSGLGLLAAALILSSSANAAVGRDPQPDAYRYTDNPARASAGRILPIYIDRDFNEGERQRIASAIKQWNHVLNGFLRLEPELLPNASPQALAQIRRSGGWFVARIDSRHSVARQPEVRQAMAMTVGGNGGIVYVISDRFPPQELTAVMLHEFGHVLGAGHDDRGHLMASVYDRRNGHCIDRGAAAMVAAAQRVSVSRFNWCVGPGLEMSQR